MGLTRHEALQVLGLEDDASEKDIRERFKHLAKKWHPDKNLENPKEAEEKFQKLSAAYSKLTKDEEIDQDNDDAITLAELLIEIFGRRRFVYDPTPNLSCDCVHCQREDIKDEREEEWRREKERIKRTEERPRMADFKSEYEETAEKIYGDHLVTKFADKLYNNFNQPRRTFKKDDSSKVKISSEEASRNADQLLEAEEKAKKDREKKRERNKKKKEAKKRRKAEQGGHKGGEEDRDSGGQEDAEDVDENNFDITSAFMVRASKKQSSSYPPPKPPLSSSTSTLPASSTETVSSDLQTKENTPPNTSYHHEHTMTTTTDKMAANRSSGAETFEPDLARSRQLASLGNRAAKDGHYGEAVRRYTEAIGLYPFDHRYFGNRSFCYDYLHEYTRALEDANKAIELDVSWPKGYYRQGRAYYGLMRLEQAEKSYMLALRYDPQYRDAEDELIKIRVEQLTAMGFSSELCEPAVREFKTVQAAIDAILAGKVVVDVAPVTNGYAEPLPDPPQHKQVGDKKMKYELPPRMLNRGNTTPKAVPKVEKSYASLEKRSLWVGNITSDDVTEKMLYDLFKKYGDLNSVRLLPVRRCAFVNYKDPESAAEALKGLQGHHLGGCYLLLRYPETSNKNPYMANIKKPGPVNGNECYYWRTTGCSFGNSCKWEHIPDNKGCDLSMMM